MRKFKPKNNVTRRWVLTMKTDKQMQLPQGEGQMGTARFPRQTAGLYLQTNSPSSTWPRFRMSCPMAASKGWDLFRKSSTIFCCKTEVTCGMIPTRADRCCHVLYSIQSRERAREHWEPGAFAQQNGTKDAFTESREQSEMEAAFEKRWIPALGNHQFMWMISLEQVETKWNNVF